MNAKIRRAIDDIERTKAKITELQALLPELERKKFELENTEIIRLVRSVDVAPDNLTDFIAAYNASMSGAPQNSAPAARQEVYDDEEV